MGKLVRVVIYPRNGRWYARWWDARLKKIERRSLGTNDYRSAKGLAAELAQDMTQGLPGKRPLVPLEILILRFLAHQKGRVSAGWLGNQRHHLELFVQRCPMRDATKVRAAHVREFLKRLRLSPATQNRYRASLSALFKFAKRDGVVSENPVALTDQHAEVRRLPTYLPKKVVEAAMAKAKGTPLEIPLALGVFAGLRRGEICGLRWQDVDEEQGELLVRHSRNAKGKLVHLKDREERTVPVSRHLKGRLVRTGPSPFVATRKRKGWRPEYLTRQVRAFGEEIGVDELNGPQILRRTFATHLVSAGESIGQVAAWLGDGIAVVEKHYARFIPGKRGRIDEVF